MLEGDCSALIAEAADEPGPADEMGCGRVVVMPETGSVLEAGHSPFGGFALRAAQVDASEAGTPFGCGVGAAMVEVVEACEERDEDEFVRWTLLRGMNMAPLGPASALHACRLMFWKFTGGATAVIGVGVRGRAASVEMGLLPSPVSHTRTPRVFPAWQRKDSNNETARNASKQATAAAAATTTSSCTHASRADAAVKTVQWVKKIGGRGGGFAHSLSVVCCS